ncbi:MAG: toll/interleukin-1 receptor domain-containing protein [Pseudomonadales bacterium]|jgi:tetratricopeptide (TPR) repeat protein
MAIFVSYSRRDRTKVELIVDILERCGETVWWDRELDPGSAFGNEIQQQLEAATSIVVVWSADSVASGWVRSEAGFGYDHGKLVPVALDRTTIPVPFNNLDTIDLSGWPDTPQHGEVARLTAAISRLQPDRQPHAANTGLPDPSLSVRVAKRVLEGFVNHGAPSRLNVLRDQIDESLVRLYRHASAQLNLLSEASCGRAAAFCEELEQRDVDPQVHLNLHFRALWYARVVRDEAEPTPEALDRLPLNKLIGYGLIGESHTLLNNAMRKPDTEIMFQVAVFVLLPLELYELADSYLEKVVASEPDYAEARFHLARSAALRQNWHDCLDILDSMLDSSPDSEIALTYRALVLSIIGYLRDGLSEFEHLLRRGGGHWLSKLASGYVVSSDKRQAAMDAWRALEDRISLELSKERPEKDSVDRAEIADDARLRLVALTL